MIIVRNSSGKILATHPDYQTIDPAVYGAGATAVTASDDAVTYSPFVVDEETGAIIGGGDMIVAPGIDLDASRAPYVPGGGGGGPSLTGSQLAAPYAPGGGGGGPSLTGSQLAALTVLENIDDYNSFGAFRAAIIAALNNI